MKRSVTKGKISVTSSLKNHRLLSVHLGKGVITYTMVASISNSYFPPPVKAITQRATEGVCTLSLGEGKELSWRYEKPFATGTFKSLYRATLIKKDSRKITRVALLVSDLSKPGAKEIAENEKNMLLCLDHKNVVKVMHHENVDYNGKESSFLVQDLYDRDLFGELKRCEKEDISVQISKISSIIKQLLDGVVYLHNKKIIHRDLKEENILLTKKLNDPSTRAVIGDFGWACNEDTAKTVQVDGGTSLYLAPEVCAWMLGCTSENNPVSKKIDVYAFGGILYRIEFGELIRENFESYENREPEFLWNYCANWTPKLIGMTCSMNSVQEVGSKIFSRDKAKTEENLHCSSKGPWESLIIAMLSLNPTMRPTIQEVQQEFLAIHLNFGFNGLSVS